MWFASQFVPVGQDMGQKEPGQDMGQNCKVVHRPDKLFCTAESNRVTRCGVIQPVVLLAHKLPFQWF
jgi:hypothetical protein